MYVRKRFNTNRVFKFQGHQKLTHGQEHIQNKHLSVKFSRVTH